MSSELTMKTALTDVLGIKYPIIQASMAWITDAHLAASVSEAGGLGTIGPNAGQTAVTRDVDETGERLRRQIRKCREQTNKPFAVNFVVGNSGQDQAYSERCVEVGIEEGVGVGIVSQGSPAVYTERLKKSGMKVLQVCSTVRHARKAQDCGVDAVITSGAEGGGHSGFDLITSFCLVPQVVDALDIPVVAGGGIGDHRGLLASLSLGADGIYMGTRFMMTKECPAHDNVKEMILDIRDTGTISVNHGSRDSTKSDGNKGFAQERRGSIRLVMNPFLVEFFRKRGEYSLDDSFNYLEPFISGELDQNTVPAGQISGMINDIPTCADLINSMVNEAKISLTRINGAFQNAFQDPRLFQSTVGRSRLEPVIIERGGVFTLSKGQSDF
jgi:NAD(P)H-dependent flavin oxidoreductase YrpB (nitropropane dioxygenase family)